MIEAVVARLLSRALAGDERVVVLGPGLDGPAGDDRAGGLLDAFGPHRVRSTPPGGAAALCGVAAGAAAAGLRPVVLLPDLGALASALGQLARAAAYRTGDGKPLPVAVLTRSEPHPRCQLPAGVPALLAGVPGCSVVLPSGARDLVALLPSALASAGPVVLLEPGGAQESEPVPDELPPEPLGTARYRRAGTDVTVVALGRLVGPALVAADRLAGRGIDTEVVDPRTLAPLDLGCLLSSVARTGRMVVADDGAGGAEVVARVEEAAFYDLDAPIVRVTPVVAPARPGAPVDPAAVAAVEAAVARVCR